MNTWVYVNNFVHTCIKCVRDTHRFVSTSSTQYQYVVYIHSLSTYRHADTLAHIHTHAHARTHAHTCTQIIPTLDACTKCYNVCTLTYTHRHITCMDPPTLYVKFNSDTTIIILLSSLPSFWMCYEYAYACMYVYIGMDMYVCICAPTYIHTHVGLVVYAPCTCTCTCTHACENTLYTYIHTCYAQLQLCLVTYNHIYMVCIPAALSRALATPKLLRTVLEVIELLIARKFVEEDDADNGLISVSSPSLVLLLAGDGSPDEGMDTDCLIDLLCDESCAQNITWWLDATCELACLHTHLASFPMRRMDGCVWAMERNLFPPVWDTHKIIFGTGSRDVKVISVPVMGRHSINSSQ